MALRAKGEIEGFHKLLQKKAEKFELKKLQVIEVTKERVSALDTLLEDVYATQRPKPTDYEVRKDLVRVFNEIAKEIYGKSKDIPVVVEFGSFVMDLFSTTSDLDLSVNFSSNADFPREKKIQTLRKFARKLYAIQSMGHVHGVLPITTAKVPILKCVDRGTGVECDISVENRDGISKSRIIGIISLIDERFKKLSFLLKTWAKAHNINSSRDKTLNSLSIILLVAFHLQTRNPPILPPFSAIFKDGNDPAAVEKSMPNFVNYGQRNRESLAELFITLLLKLSSVGKLWPKGLCASTWTASWTSKTWDSKVASISVEDFSDRSQNVARAVGVAEVKRIYKCIDISIQNITSFMNGQIGFQQMKDLLFGVEGVTTSIPRGITNLNLVAPVPCIPSQANQTRGTATGKRKKIPMRNGSYIKNRRFGKGSRPGTQPGHREQVQLVETSFSKKMRTDKGWRGMPYGSCAVAQVESQFGTRHVELTSSQQRNGGWGEMCTRGWEQTKQTAAGGWEQSVPSAAGGWEETYRPGGSGWGVSQQNRWGVWGAMQAGGGGWEGGNQQPNVEVWGAIQAGGGGGGGGWEGGNQQPNVGGWGWGGSQQHFGGSWAQTSDHRTYPTRF